MFELILTICTGWAYGALSGPPGRCMSTGLAPAGVYRSFDECNRAYQREAFLGQRSYVYVGLFTDRRVQVNRVRSGVCRRVDR